MKGPKASCTSQGKVSDYHWTERQGNVLLIKHSTDTCTCTIDITLITCTWISIL